MTDPIAALNTALDGRYAIERELGEGGMATVYLADDLRHSRKVALKVLKPELAAVVGADRFLTEIETTANLQHPNILPLFDSGEADGFLFYVMPYVEGENLQQKLDREKQLPVDEAVSITRDAAEALQAAHEQGVIHRDIKPANILLSRGKPLVADFGIALAVSAAGGGRLTETGLSLGTPFYMSPEQASADRDPSAASDVYALACVLYEMLVGEPPYTGASAQAVLAKILMEDAKAPTVARPSIPANVDAAIRRALEKLPADRFATIQEFADALKDPNYRYGEAAGAVATGVSAKWKRISYALGGLAAVLALALGWSINALRAPEVRPLSRYIIGFDEDREPMANVRGVVLSVAPDGSRVVYAGSGASGGTQVWQRALDDLEPRPIPGTEGAISPVVSPDGSSVLYWVENGLSTIPLSGGPPFRVVPNHVGAGLAWGSDGYIYYTDVEDGRGGISRVPATGGEPSVVTEAPEQGQHRWPELLPGGEGLLITLQTGAPESSRIGVARLETGEVIELFPGAMARYATTGHLVYAAAGGTLMAVPFDESALEVTGAAVALLSGIQVGGGSNAQFSVSSNGTLVYRSGTTQSGLRQVVWVTRDGELTPVDPDWMIDPSSPESSGAAEVALALSPDGSRVALKIYSDAGEDIWVKELDDGPLSRLTFDPAPDRRPRWSPDGTRILFSSDRGENADLWVRRADGTGSAELLLDFDRAVHEALVTPDESWFVLRLGGQAASQGGRDLMGLQAGDTTLIPMAAEDYDEKAAALSPDGRWLAYESTETGTEQVYVRPFPNADDGKWQVSTNGGQNPVWARDGTELFYIDGSGMMTAVAVETDGGFRVGEREELFSVPERNIDIQVNYPFWDVTPDGQRFIMARFDLEGSAPVNDVIIVENWFEELTARVGN
jgi:serine/threonine-protein kinase